MRAARGHPLRRGLYDLDGPGFIEMTIARGRLGGHHLTGQRAGDEGDLATLAVAAGNATAVMAEVEDVGLEGSTVEAGAGSGHVATGCGQKGCVLSQIPTAN